MGELLFITGNKRKVQQAQDCLGQHGITIRTKDLDVIEIQSHEPLDIIKHKVLEAYSLAQEPVVVCDHFWQFHALNGWPGGYMKDMNHWLTEHDFLRLMQDKQDRTTTLTEAIAYTADGVTVELFTSRFGGRVIDEPRGTGFVACERIVVFDGQDKTIAEQIDTNQDSRNMNRSAWHKFAKEYVSALK